jgi:hypothetical protein
MSLDRFGFSRDGLPASIRVEPADIIIPQTTLRASLPVEQEIHVSERCFQFLSFAETPQNGESQKLRSVLQISFCGGRTSFAATQFSSPPK